MKFQDWTENGDDQTPDSFMVMRVEFQNKPLNFCGSLKGLKLYQKHGVFELERLLKSNKVTYNSLLELKWLGDYYMG